MIKNIKRLWMNIKYLCKNDLQQIRDIQDLRVKHIKIGVESLLRKFKEDIDKQFNIDLDVHHKPNYHSNVIVTGIYRNEEYIKIYSLKPRDFNDLVEQLKNREKFGEIRSIDATRGFPRQEFKAKFKKFI